MRLVGVRIWTNIAALVFWTVRGRWRKPIPQRKDAVLLAHHPKSRYTCHRQICKTVVPVKVSSASDQDAAEISLLLLWSPEVKWCLACTVKLARFLSIRQQAKHCYDARSLRRSRHGTDSPTTPMLRCMRRTIRGQNLCLLLHRLLLTTDMSYIKNIAIVGAGGRVGNCITPPLLAQGKHVLTAITRADSANKLPADIHRVEKVDYASHQSLVAAMHGQDALIISMNVMAPQDTQTKLIDAAVEAGVKYILVNEWGMDADNEQRGKEMIIGPGQHAVRRYVEKVGAGKTHWIAISCSFWYEFSLAGTEARYGFDFASKKLTLFDDGNQKHTTSTWPQVGRAVAALFSLPISSTQPGTPSLSQFDDRAVLISSFEASQRDMLASVLRVTGDDEKDWTITSEEAHARYQRGSELFKKGDFLGFGILLYTRAFYPEDPALVPHEKLHNTLLGLPQEDIDEATRVAVDMANKGQDFIGTGR
nr:hypothetical protein CFP56_13161 [Quercus suber]